MPKLTRTLHKDASDQLPEGTVLGLERLVFFSDAVIAIAITLLVLDIKLPEQVGGTAVAFSQLRTLLPKCLGWAVSFWVIALYWVAHHRCYRYIQRYDRRLMYLNFLFLMFIAFMPFPTSLLFTNAILTTSVILYAGAAAGMGLSLAGLWIYAVRHRFIAPHTSPILVRDIRLNLVLPPVIFLGSCMIAVFSPTIASLSWLLLIPVYLLRRRSEGLLLEDPS